MKDRQIYVNAGKDLFLLCDLLLRSPCRLPSPLILSAISQDISYCNSREAKIHENI